PTCTWGPCLMFLKTLKCMDFYRFSKHSILVIMRGSAIGFAFVLLSLQLAFARSAEGQTVFDRKVSLQVRNETLETTLQMLGKWVNVDFVYSTHSALSDNVNLSARDRKLGEVLKELLEPAKLRWELVGQTIVIRNFSTAAPALPPSAAARIELVIKGFVKDGMGNSLPGVS